MDCGTPKVQVLSSMGTQTRIGREIVLIESQPRGLANYLVGPLCVGLQRNKIVFLSLPPRLST
jgi:hypothetical protein